MELMRILLRLAHMLGGTFWVGGNLLLAAFIQPTVERSGPEGGRFLQRLMSCTPLPVVMNVSAVLTTAAGLILYWMDSNFQLSWILSREGLLLTIGSLAGLAAFFTGLFVRRPTAQRIAVLGNEMQTGGPPRPQQIAEMQALQGRMRRTGYSDAILMVIAVVTMATARLW